MEEDRISELPDAILEHILSSIELKQAVQTSILSKRWTNIWSSMPHLDFHFSRLTIQSGVDLSNPHDCEVFMHRFTHFVIKFLSHGDESSTIYTFKLSLFSQLALSDSRFIQKSLDYAINHGVQHLDLHAFCYPTPFNFPVSFFASKMLRDLRLRQSADSFVIPKSFVLPYLKTLRLERFAFKDDGDIYSFSKEPFSGFPVLEKLTLHQCEISGLIIFASKLEILEISFQDTFALSEAKMEQIATPRLTSCRYEGYGPLECAKVDFPLLEEVYLNISTNLGPYYRGDKKMTLNFVSMLEQLGNAKVVALTLDTIKVLEMDPCLLEQSPSPFPYIKCLKLTKGPYVIHRRRHCYRL